MNESATVSEIYGQTSDTTFGVRAVHAMPAGRVEELKRAHGLLEHLVTVLRPLGEALDAFDRAQPPELFANLRADVQASFDNVRAAERTAHVQVTDYSSEVLNALDVQLHDIVEVREVLLEYSTPDRPVFGHPVRLDVESCQLAFVQGQGCVVLSGCHVNEDGKRYWTTPSEAHLTPGSTVRVLHRGPTSRPF